MRRESRECFPRHRLQRKPLVSDTGMHHGTCVTHVPWCMSGSLTRRGRENVPGIPGACTTRNFTYLVRVPLALGLRFLNAAIGVIGAQIRDCIAHEIWELIDNPWPDRCGPCFPAAVIGGTVAAVLVLGILVTVLYVYLYRRSVREHRVK